MGLGALVYFAFGFDTSIANASSDGGRIGNLGLQNDRVCGCIFGAALTIAGAVMGGYMKEGK